MLLRHRKQLINDDIPNNELDSVTLGDTIRVNYYTTKGYNV